MSTHSFHIEKSIKYIAIPLYTLAAICFMIYTTQQSYTFADSSTEDLGYDITSANASVTVGTACTFTGTVTAPHTATIANGINSTNIGTTVLNTTCNDTGGYALYAIGFAGNEYGTTDLSYTSLDNTTTNSNYNIPTGTATSGNTSNWSMKLSPVAGTTTATIENNYSSYSIVPDDYTKVATLNTVTDPGSSTAGSSVSTTYQAYISPTQPAGTYTGKVKYTLVHPSTAPAPPTPHISKITYMQDFIKFNEEDMRALKKSMIEGRQYQLMDSRDGKTYYVSRLADGNVWMTQNLDFDIDSSKTYTSADTDISADWTPVRGTATSTTWDTSVTGQFDPYSYDPGNLYWNAIISTTGGNLSNNTVSDPSATPGGSHYHIGNYYNWTAAVAMNDSSSNIADIQDVNQSVCPAGWRLPTYSGDKSYRNLIDAQSLTSGIDGDIQSNPAYYTYGGAWTGNSGSVGHNGRYWSSIARNNYLSYLFYFNVLGGLSTQQWDNRSYGLSLRCVAR